MDKSKVFSIIKSAFCGLMDFKDRGTSLEIITPFTTLNNKFISIFIKEQSGKFIISDGGWISKDYYNTILDEDSEDILNRILYEYQNNFDVKNQVSLDWTYYYKVCDSLESIASESFDLANFISSVVNSREIKYKDEKEVKEREKFRSNANEFLSIHYKDKVSFRKSLDDFPNIKYNAIIERDNSLFLFSYITGSSNYYFENELRKSIVNFEIADKSRLRKSIKEKIAFINDRAEGFNYERSSAMIDLLSERSSLNINWSEKEKVLEII